VVSSSSVPASVPRDPRNPWRPSAFARLARTHFFSVGGDVAFTAAMAGTVFFNVSNLDQARWHVAGTLIFTVAPFAVAAPLIGPLVDRAAGGRKWMIMALSLLRMLVCIALVTNRDQAVFFYPEALLMLVFSKGYLIARGAIVPTTVTSDAELVEANSKLALISGVAGAAGAIPAGLLLKLGGPGWTLGFAAIMFAVTTVLSFQLPVTRVAAEPVDETEREELRGAGIRHAAKAMGLVRGIVGFIAFLLAFHFKQTNSALGIGVALVSAQAGFLVGAAVAPRARRVLSEERMLTTAIAVMAAAAMLTMLMSPLAGAGLLALAIGITSNLAKQSFDAIVQRDAPDANRGRSFARFETRFQLVWVLGALVPVAITMPPKVGYALIAGVSLFALVSYDLGMRRARTAARPDPIPDHLPDPFADATLVTARTESGARRPRSWARPGPMAATEPVGDEHHQFGVPDTDTADTTHLFGVPDSSLPEGLSSRPGGGLFEDRSQPQLYDGAHDLDEVDGPASGTVDATAVALATDVVDPTTVAPPTDDELAYREPAWRDGETPPLPGFEP
jgi:MFS family permease